MARKKAVKKVRTRAQRLTLDEQMMGPMPTYDVGATPKDPDSFEYRKELMSGLRWFSYFFGPKENKEYHLKFATDIMGYTPKKIQALKALPDWKLNQGLGSSVRMWAVGWEYPEAKLEVFKERITEHLEKGKEILKEKKNAPVKKVISPAERLKAKFDSTIYHDWDTLVLDEWMNGNFDIKFPVYDLYRSYSLKGAAINMLRDLVQFEYDVISDAYNKKCDQAMEAYSHVKRTDQNKMIKTMDNIFAELQRLSMSATATRKPRTLKRKTSDKQVEKLNYCKDNQEAQLTSINPVLIPDKEVLYVYNIKQKNLFIYKAEEGKGFEVRGSTLYKWNVDESKVMKLRKPDEILPLIISQTVKQNDKIIKSLTTKVNQPSGRINKDCILLKCL